MAVAAARVVVKIGQILWRRHKRNERNERFQRQVANYHAGLARDTVEMRKGLQKMAPQVKWKREAWRWDWARTAMHDVVEQALDAAADTAVRSAKRLVRSTPAG